jgi:hypothetical protein
MDRMDGNATLLGSRNSVVAFVPGVSAQERADIEDVLLHAQLFASHSHDKNEYWSSWIHVYRTRLEARGFQRKSVITGDSELLSSVDDLFQATFKIVGSAASRPLVDLVRGSFHNLGVSQIAEAFFDGNIASTRLGSFQIIPCEKSASGAISLLLCGLQLGSDGYTGGQRRLIFHFKGGVYQFDREAYAAHRASVSAYLHGKADAYVKRIQI